MMESYRSDFVLGADFYTQLIMDIDRSGHEPLLDITIDRGTDGASIVLDLTHVHQLRLALQRIEKRMAKS